MKIALVGYGKMGKLLEAKALERGHQISAIVDPYIAEEKSSPGTRIYKSLDSLLSPDESPDLAIEFTRPDTAAENLLFLLKHKIPAITGTTGWDNKMPEIRAAAKESGTSIFWAPNFSLGMNLFYLLASYAAEIFDPFSEYDVGGFECHHNKKADSPSGTARALTEKLLGRMTRKKKAVFEKLDRPPAPDEIHFSSLRVGSVQGIHSIVIDSAADTIELTHTLRSREGLVAGALKAADWLIAQKKTGFFTMDDMLADILRQ